MFSNMRGDLFAMGRRCMLKDPLNQVVAILITGDCGNVSSCFLLVSVSLTINQWYPRSVCATFTNSIKISFKKFGTSNFEAFLDYLRCVLIHTVFRSIVDDNIDCPTSICWSPVLTIEWRLLVDRRCQSRK